jgi:hypothetical protein
MISLLSVQQTKNIFIALFFLPILMMCSCNTSTKFSQWEGSTTLKGVGGAKEVVDGIDIWTTGSPPREYKIVGVINDERGTGRLYMARQLEDLAKEAKANGGDAIIMGGKDTKYLGSINTGGTSVTSGTAQTFGNNTYYNSTSYNSGGLSMAAMRQNTQAFVIKYL